MANSATQRMETKLIHGGEPRPNPSGAVVMPIYQSSTFLCDPTAGYHGNRYIRLNNTPNHDALHAKLAALENAEAALVMSSGMAAIATTLVTLLGGGDHMIAQSNLYGGTHTLLTHDLVDLGIGHTFVDAQRPETWRAAVRKETKVFYCETITNPLLEVGDLPAIARFAREHDLVSVIDNTFASPVNFNPIDHGFDLVIHSCTKSLNGHNDLVAGAVIGDAERVERIRHRLNHFGGALDPHACFLLHRGIKTLAVRMKHQNESAVRIARFLADHPNVLRVNYPALDAHPQFARARELFRGCGGVLSFEVKGGGEVAARLLTKVRIPLAAWSLGGVESLITQPATTSHAGLSSDERNALGISDALIRLSIGLEATEDLMADLDQALERT